MVSFVTSAKVIELKAGRTIHIGDDEITFEFDPRPERFRPLAYFDNVDDVNYVDDANADYNVDVPDSESPQNILNTLNDDCLHEILAKLKWQDLYATADVCHRIRDIAQQVTTKRTLKIMTKVCKPLWRVERYLRMFGASIRTVHIAVNFDVTNIMLLLLSKYCANVDEITLSYYDGRITNETQSFIQRQRKISILQYARSLDGILRSDSSLESLNLAHAIDSNILPPMHLPRLVEFRVREFEQIGQFLALNQQIEKLTLDDVRFYDGSLRHLPNLQELILNTDAKSEMASASDFGRFSHLHTFEMNTCWWSQICMILRAFIDGGVLLKRLTLLNSIEYPIDLICKMKSIEYLRMEPVYDEDLVRLTTNCINLNEIDFFDSSELTFDGIIDALTRLPRHSCLRKAKLKINMDEIELRNGPAEITIFEDKIDAIAELRTNRRVDVKLHMFVTIYSYAEDIQVSRRK